MSEKFLVELLRVSALSLQEEPAEVHLTRRSLGHLPGEDEALRKISWLIWEHLLEEQEEEEAGETPPKRTSWD